MAKMGLRLIVLVAILNVVVAKEVGTSEKVKTLNDGNKIPGIALGTAGSDKDIRAMRDVISWAVQAGYRHIDTASFYGNEEQIGLGIEDVVKKGLVKREDLFVTTKLWNDRHEREQVVPALKESLERLKLDYVDLYLIHFPIAMKPDGSSADIDYLETWKGMEEAKKLGLTKSIGVSNFNIEQLDRLTKNSEIKPAVHEFEVNPSNTQHPLVDHSTKLGMAVMAYCPQGFLVSRDVEDAPPPRIDDPTLKKIADAHKKTTNQVVLRYLIERGLIPIPKSTNQERLKQNIDLFDFKLTNDEVAAIDKFNKDKRVVEIEEWKDYPYYPFTKA